MRSDGRSFLHFFNHSSFDFRLQICVREIVGVFVRIGGGLILTLSGVRLHKKTWRRGREGAGTGYAYANKRTRRRDDIKSSLFFQKLSPPFSYSHISNTVHVQMCCFFRRSKSVNTFEHVNTFDVNTFEHGL